jgi:hypothetical protein
LPWSVFAPVPSIDINIRPPVSKEEMSRDHFFLFNALDNEQNQFLVPGRSVCSAP